MVNFGNSSGTTPCPECGNPMGLVSWVGEKPVCAGCAGATTTNFDYKSELSFDDGEECAHEILEENLPLSMKGEPHHLVCNCPKCSIIC
jgi:hypothetical protein